MAQVCIKIGGVGSSRLLGPWMLALFFCACSTAQRQVISDADHQETVPKKEYQELLAKYKALEEKNRLLEAKTGGDELRENSPSTLETIAEVETTPDLVETVDIFAPRPRGPEGKRGPTSVASPPQQRNTVDVDVAIQQVREGIDLVAQKQYAKALETLRPLESSPIGQVRVRAKFYIGEALFGQEEYDLAMQVFEDILAKESFSGLVLKALGRLVVCSEKLNIKKKQETYYSMLHDFFEN